MDIAVTADVHLSAGENHAERYNALGNILASLAKKQISTLIIAGDLFDKSCDSYSGFEDICSKYPGISVHVIPGNHDPGISDSAIVGENINIHDSLSLSEFDGLSFVFLPYSATSGMGEYLGAIDLPKRWVLIGHGDYFGGLKQRNPYEKGTYMPLYRKDIEKYSPWKVFLGHIHKPTNIDNLFYPGSPCGIDINETGKRRYLLFNTATGHVVPATVQTDMIFFNETFLVIPGDNEIARLQKDVKARISAWNLYDKGIARIRVKATGYASDRKAIKDFLEKEFSAYSFVKDEGPDISSLRIVSDIRRNVIATRAVQLIEEMDWEFGENEPTREQVIEAALRSVYGGNSG